MERFGRKPSIREIARNAFAGTTLLIAGTSCADTIPIPKITEAQTPSAGAPVRATETPSQAPAKPPTKWYLTGGPHYDGLSGGVKYAIDVAPGNSNRCPGGNPVIDSPFPSPVEGKVIAAGKNPTAADFSMVEVSTPSGEIIGAMHLANIKVEQGDSVRVGQLLGNPSCDSPPGGRSDGTHIHLYRKGIDGEPLTMAGVEFSEGTIFESGSNYNGTMRKGNVIKTADSRHCGPSVCAEIRNDLLEPLRLISTGHGSFRLELRTADGKPIFNQTAYIFSVKKDIDGNPKPDKEIKRISSEDLGVLQATLPSGEYLLLFKRDSGVKGSRISENEPRTGQGIIVEKDELNSQKIQLGRVSIEIKDKDGNPSGNASACLSEREASNLIIGCEDANDINGIINVDALAGDYNLEVDVGKKNAIYLFGRGGTPPFPVSVESGEIGKISCAIDFEKQSGTCTQ